MSTRENIRLIARAPYSDEKRMCKENSPYRRELSQIRGYQGSHRLEKYLNIHGCLEKSLKIKFA